MQKEYYILCLFNNAALVKYLSEPSGGSSLTAVDQKLGITCVSCLTRTNLESGKGIEHLLTHLPLQIYWLMLSV